ncbi:MAG: hypothetical protein AAF098_13475 [Pseudomonadota bacterium]
MSTFAVFGMTESFAREKAKRTTKRYCNGKHLSESEWLEAVNENAELLIGKSKKVERISQLFDSPQFAEEYIEIAKKQRHRDLHIKAYVFELDSDGRPIPNKKTGKPRAKWKLFNSKLEVIA